MKNKGIRFLWALCVTVLGVCAHGAEVAPAANTAESVEAAGIRAGLDNIGVGEGYEIVLADDCDAVERTAAQMMQEFLAKGALSVGIVRESQAAAEKRILLGRESNFKAIRDLGDKGVISIRDVAADEDGFHVKKTGKTVVVAGANPRGVLCGVCAFQDLVNEGRKGEVDIKKVPAFRSRVHLIPTFLVADHPASYRDAVERDAKYLARLGTNGCIDGGGACWDLSKFVSSDVFPFQKPPDPALQKQIATRSAALRKYGIDHYIMLWEPMLPASSADLGAYPPDALGGVKLPWGGEPGAVTKTLCVSSPIVQDHYRNMVGKFVQQYPDVKGFLFYNLDGGAWLCAPGLCPRCKSVCTDSPPDKSNPWETQAAFTDLLARAAKEKRPDFGFVHWFTHFDDAAAEKLLRTAKEYTGMARGLGAGDHDLLIADSVKPTPQLLMLQKICAERSLPFYIIFSSDSHEVIANGFPFPFAVRDSMRKLQSWGFRDIMGSGPIPYFNQVNALAEKAFRWNPDQDPETFLADLSVRQFGPEAGRVMYQAWEEIRDGMNVWKDATGHPFCGSYTLTALGFSYFPFAKAIVPDILQSYTSIPPEYPDRFQLMGMHLEKAAALAKQAIDKADATHPIGINYYEGDSVPTMREYAELNYGPIAIADTYCRLRCNVMGACHLLNGMEADRAAGNEAGAKEKEAQYHQLIRDDIALRKGFIELLTQFSKMEPCLTRTSLSEQGIANQIAYMNTEIGKMETYLSQSKE